MRGTTSACAENTTAFAQVTKPGWNYLRVRGEYQIDKILGGKLWELPPRARRIRTKPSPLTNLPGTTSACAENTLNELGLL